jgi:hypothetical protein
VAEAVLLHIQVLLLLVWQVDQVAVDTAVQAVRLLHQAKVMLAVLVTEIMAVAVVEQVRRVQILVQVAQVRHLHYQDHL